MAAQAPMRPLVVWICRRPPELDACHRACELDRQTFGKLCQQGAKALPAERAGVAVGRPGKVDR